MKKDLIAKLILSISLPFILFFILEFVLALFGIKAGTKTLEIEYLKREDWRFFHMYSDKHFVPDPDFLWKGSPNEFGFNSNGFHSGEFKPEKEENSIRVFCLGDSNTLGTFNYSYPEMLEIALNEKSCFEKFEVYNFGIYGYSSKQGLEVLKKFISLKPNFVIISFGWNDAVLAGNLDDEEYIEKYKKIHDNIFVDFLKRTRTFNAVRTLIYISRKKTRVSLEKFRKNYSEMIEICSKEGITPIILIRPNHLDPEEIKGDWRENVYKYNEAALEIGTQNNITVINADKYIIDEKFFLDECHYNLEGYQELVKLLTPLILK